jgi:hypothetical protein
MHGSCRFSVAGLQRDYAELQARATFWNSTCFVDPFSHFSSMGGVGLCWDFIQKVREDTGRGKQKAVLEVQVPNIILAFASSIHKQQVPKP